MIGASEWQPDERAVERVAKELAKAWWTGYADAPLCDRDRAVARMVLKRQDERERLLLAALRQDLATFELGRQPTAAQRVRDVLAAHAALDAEQPKDLTLAEAVEAMLEDRRFANEESFVGVRLEHFNALKNALARERRQP